MYCLSVLKHIIVEAPKNVKAVGTIRNKYLFQFSEATGQCYIITVVRNSKNDVSCELSE